MRLRDEILTRLQRRGSGFTVEELAALLYISPEVAGDHLADLRLADEVDLFGDRWFSLDLLDQKVETVHLAISKLRTANPEFVWWSRQDVMMQAKLSWSGRTLARITQRMESLGHLRIRGNWIAIPGDVAEVSTKQRAFLNRMVEAIEATWFPADTHFLARQLAVPPPAVTAMLKLGLRADLLVEVESGWVSTERHWARLPQVLREHFGEKTFSDAEVRDALALSREIVARLLSRMREDHVVELTASGWRMMPADSA